MKIIEQSWQFEQKPADALEVLERAARNCYKSEAKIAEGTAETLLKALIRSGHHSVLEHCDVSVKLIIDRAVAMEILRHRIGAAYSMESQRYVSYKASMEFIKPSWYNSDNEMIPFSPEWCLSGMCEEDELCYKKMIREGLKPEDARVILPNCTKTELFMTMNFRAWRHFFELRCSKKAYPQIRKLALDMLQEFYKEWPVLFDDLSEIYLKETKNE